MTKEILAAIKERIRTQFTAEEYRIYTEQPEQDMEKPCFVIKEAKGNLVHLKDNRYSFTSSFSVHYHSGETEPLADCYGVSETLYDVLEYIQVNSKPLKAITMSSETGDNSFIFSVEYCLFLLKEKLPDKHMERIDVNAKAKAS